jgi:hypothetical protein
MLPRWEESPSEGLGEVHSLEAEALVTEELETEVPQKPEGMGIFQCLDQLEQVTARYFSRLVLLPKIHTVYGICKKCSL